MSLWRGFLAGTQRAVGLASLAFAAAAAAGPAPGENVEVRTLRFDEAGGVCSYVLAERALVRVRYGIKLGCLLATPVDWEVQEAGPHTVPFQVADGSAGTAPLPVDLSRVRVSVQACAVPDDPALRAAAPPQRFERLAALARAGAKTPADSESAARLNPFWRSGLALEPRFDVVFSNGVQTASGAWALPGKARFVIATSDDKQPRFSLPGGELTVYLDFDFLMEEDAPAARAERALDLSRVPPGEHLLTFNLRDPENNVGTRTYRVLRPNDADRAPTPAAPLPPHLRP